ncbi:DENN domain-containing protein 11-like [Halichondria panicea]|uniref:DENN domain-containing protein 11-like n=1 Tax=Halichondria panicea TaxID=6063 RepID=UPI00312B2E09
MASRDEARIPLLAGTDEYEASQELLEDIQVEYAMRTPPREVSGEHLTTGGGDIKRRKHYSGSEMIVAVFVVAFDTKKGNLVEWRYPEEVLLSGVEFKSMASGLHNMQKDFIYFKQNQLFGLSCYVKIPVANQEERGARMKCVGLLAVGYSNLHLHMDFLQRQARILVETPGSYGSLEEYFRHYRSPAQVPHPLTGPEATNSVEACHPSGCFTTYLQFFGASIFVLWKLALLKKKIIFFSPPPVGALCHRVYCTCLLTSHVLPNDLNTECNPQFYVNVADIDAMTTMDSYVACTTEKIFQIKTQLYDVFVDGERVTSNQERMDPLLRVNQCDEQRYEHLNHLRSNQRIASGRRSRNDELGFAEFFQELNCQMFRTVMDAASSEDHVLTMEMVESVGLDPLKDRQFLTELASVYDLNMTVQRSTSFDLLTCCM